MKPTLSRSYALTLVCLCLIPTGYAQIQHAWLAKYNGGRPLGTNQAVAIAVDPWGNVIVCGSSKTNWNFDYVTIKYDPNGTELWTRRYSSGVPSDDQVRALAVDQDGNTYVTGTSKTIKYDPDGAPQWTAPYAGRALAVDSSSNVYVTGFSEVDFATVKLDHAGSNVWMRMFDEAGCIDVSQTIALDASGHVYVGGISQYACGGPINTHVRFAIVAYDTNGAQLWTTNSPNNSYGSAAAVKGLAVVKTTSCVYMTGNSVGEAEIYATTKYSADGQRLWDYGLGVDPYDGVAGIAVDGSGSAYLTGWYANIGTLKLSSDGMLLWMSRYGDLSQGYHFGRAICLDSAGNVYVTGKSPAAQTGTDFATIKYDNDGQQLWVQRYDGPAHGDDGGTAIAVDKSGGVYVAGYSQTASNLVELTVIKYAELQNAQLLPNGHALLQFFGTPGQSYRFQASTTLTNWVDLGSSVADTNGIYRFEDADALTYQHRFYRTVSP